MNNSPMLGFWPDVFHMMVFFRAFDNERFHETVIFIIIKNYAQEINPNKITFFVFDFENYHIFLIELFFIHDEKDMTKT